MTSPAPFPFIDPGSLRDGSLRLELAAKLAANPAKGYVPAYDFVMRLDGVAEPVGKIQLRAETTERIVLYRGHIGYSVVPEHRGQHLAARSVKLLKPLARHHRLGPVWLTCNPTNIASRRSCELAGARLVEIIPLAADEEMYQLGDREKCRYRLEL